MKISSLVAAAAMVTQLPRKGVALTEGNLLNLLSDSAGPNLLTANMGRGTFASQICKPLPMIETQQYCQFEPLPGLNIEVAISASSDLKIPEAAKAALHSVSNTEKWEKMMSDLEALGELVPKVTIANLAAVVNQRVTFKNGEGTLASWAKAYGLTQSLTLPAHLAKVIHLAFIDPNLLNIGKMGLMIAMKNPETNGVPPGGFKPLFNLLKKWGYNRQGVLVNQKKYDARVRFMETQKDDFAEFNKFLDDKSFLSLLKEYFMEFPQAKKAADEHAFES